MARPHPLRLAGGAGHPARAAGPSACLHRSAVAPASRITCPQRAGSAANWPPSRSGGPPAKVSPCAGAVCGAASTAFIASFSRIPAADGVFAGAKRANQSRIATPAMPSSATVGTSGVRRRRASAATASVRTRPSRASSAAAPTGMNMAAVWPPAGSLTLPALLRPAISPGDPVPIPTRGSSPRMTSEGGVPSAKQQPADRSGARGIEEGRDRTAG
jgi:hypothetical protein